MRAGQLDAGSDVDVGVDVAIVGFGPCGAVAAGLLGGMGVRTWICDKATEVYDKPRAFALDHEIMRVLQQLGVHDEVLAHAEPFTPSEFYGVEGQLIKRFSTVEPPFPMAFPPALVFNQPAAERILREHVATLANVKVELGCTVTGLAQDSERATLELLRADGSTGQVRARYVIACDGASSSVRAWAGIALEDLGFDQPWLVVDMLVGEEALARLPKVSIQYCEPSRPTTYLVGPGNHRRWEISINEGEDAREVATAEGTWKLLSRWLAPGDATLWRQAAYRFHALVADEWRAGRVFVAGDAAHQQPPFLGQGMCQGVRDVANLAWKLKAVLAERASDALLDTYGVERKAHVKALTTRIKSIGQLIGERDPMKARERDAQLLAECGGVVKSVPRQDLQPPLVGGLIGGVNGGLTAQGVPAGTLFPQPWLRTAIGRGRMDDVAGRGWRVVLGESAPADMRAAVVGPFVGVALGAEFEDEEGIAQAWFARHETHAAILRPDHYVYAVASTREQLVAQLQGLRASLIAVDESAALTAS